MRLTEFIEQNHKKIIEEWVEFARSLLPWAKDMSEKGLRDHAEELLSAVVRDMQAPESEHQQLEKSQGRGVGGNLASVGQKHASQRLHTGFDINQLVSEYRALRASVLRLWGQAQGDKSSEVTRFNEAIDESLTEATISYSETIDRTREQFLGILGHDLRNPLAAIVMGASLLVGSTTIDDEQARIAARIHTSAQRMARLVSDLLDFTRTRLGGGIPVTPTPMDLTAVCQRVIAELEAVHPARQLVFESSGNLLGEWDGDRLTQAISNLVANALQYGSKGDRVAVVAEGHDDEVRLRIHNHGPPISETAMKQIFEPMVRQPTQDRTDPNATGMGLGLFIAREVVTAHGGTIGVTSTAKEGTTFTVELPRHPPASPTPPDDRETSKS